MSVSLQLRPQTCMNLSTIGQPASCKEKSKVLLQFWKIDTTFLPRGLVRAKSNLCFATVLGHVFDEIVAHEQMKFALRYSFTSKWNLRFATVLGDRHHVFDERVAWEQTKFAFRHSFERSTPRFDERVAHEQMKLAFCYSFERSTPRFWRDRCARANEICVSLQFWAIDATFLTRGLRASKWNLRFVTVLGDRRHVFSERVDFRLTLPIPPGGIENRGIENNLRASQ